MLRSLYIRDIFGVSLEFEVDIDDDGNTLQVDNNDADGGGFKDPRLARLHRRSFKNALALRRIQARYLRAAQDLGYHSQRLSLLKRREVDAPLFRQIASIQARLSALKVERDATRLRIRMDILQHEVTCTHARRRPTVRIRRRPQNARARRRAPSRRRVARSRASPSSSSSDGPPSDPPPLFARGNSISARRNNNRFQYSIIAGGAS